MCYLNRVFLSALLICNPLTAPGSSTDQATSATLNEASQNHQNSNHEYLNDFRRFKSHIDSLLFALEHIIDETQQAIPFEKIQNKSRLQISQAETLYLQGNHFAGRYLMDITYREVQDLVIRSRNGSTLTQNRKPGDQYEVKSNGLHSDREIKRLNASIDALTQALDRVAAEKNMRHSTRVVQLNIVKIRDQASILQEADDAAGAIASLHRAYSLTRGALSALREGDTLTMSLDFASSKEEYEYYLEKNESQRLVLVMLSEFDPGSKKSKTLQRLIDLVDPLLLQAKSLAAKDDYDSAVPLMDKAYIRLQSGVMMALSSR